MNTSVAQQQPSSPKSIVFTFDEDGFLLNPSSWSPEVARQIALQDGIGPLTDDHWEFISNIRERYFKFGSLPPMRIVCRAAGLSRNAVKELFGSCKHVWRVAGLPNPGEEAKTYML